MSRTTTLDAAGGPTQTYTLLRTVWCRREDSRGREGRVGEAVRGQRDAEFRLRWFDGLDETCRIVCEGKTYDVVSCDEYGRRQWWVVQAAQRKGQT